MKCPKCHTDNPDESKFCKECADAGSHEVEEARERIGFCLWSFNFVCVTIMGQINRVDGWIYNLLD